VASLGHPPNVRNGSVVAGQGGKRTHRRDTLGTPLAFEASYAPRVTPEFDSLSRQSIGYKFFRSHINKSGEAVNA